MSDVAEEEVEGTAIEEPERGSIEWIHFWAFFEGCLRTPINISITGAIKYECPPILWYNFDIYPHKMKVTNTGYGLLLCSKWTTERPYITNGPFLPGLKYIFSHIHFHWGSNMMEGSEHTIDGTSHAMEMHVVYFNSLYLTQEEAFRHNDGIVIICYIIRFGVVPDKRLDLLIDALPAVQEAQKFTKVGPVPLSHIISMFVNDYFVYWGSVETKPPYKVALWIIARVPMSASEEQVKQFRRLWDPWDDPNTRNFRQLKDTEDRHIFFVNPRWSMHNSVLPILREEMPSISILSPSYLDYPETLPLLNNELRKKYIKEAEISQPNIF